MNKSIKPLLISTDLDGTLLDHHTYSWKAAEESINRLKSLNYPVIINTSKTRDEVISLQNKIGLVSPFIVENGSAIYYPENGDYREIVLGSLRQDIVNFINDIRQGKNWQFESYSDWDIETLISHTGLDLDAAKKSMLRRFSEPFIWHDTDRALNEFKQCIESAGFRLLKGGRFFHILGQSDKGQAIKSLDENYSNNTTLVCLGDSYNDLDMLAAADIAVLVRSPAYGFPEFSTDKELIRTTAMGPEGWHEAMNSIINRG
ncbi:HAD-IIB family hydrolase [Agaribacterium sp. ZY112]|uniref:HAD-IIB family hydrolase n=1 Tax=Agaribacterium sp. ZY112 TaxID=3233574 RepID=UPI003523B3A7